jgi:hypothetical protein
MPTIVSLISLEKVETLFLSFLKPIDTVKNQNVLKYPFSWTENLFCSMEIVNMKAILAADRYQCVKYVL